MRQQSVKSSTYLEELSVVIKVGEKRNEEK
jgi:hypothetical protein